MKKSFLTLLILPLLAPACQTSELTVNPETKITEIGFSLPVEDYKDLRYFKAFGEYIDDRFTGYHVGDDIEFEKNKAEIPVQTIFKGELIFHDFVSGYGGLIIIRHETGDLPLNSLYGHLDLSSSTLAVGDQVESGEFIANLGDHESEETDGERKHLHFALYEGEDLRLNGYEQNAEQVSNWINPQNFFTEKGLNVQPKSYNFNSGTELGGDIFNLNFDIPSGMGIEYIPSLEALNIYSLDEQGSARERSQILVRYFDASSFLTLNTITIHETEDLTIGVGDYTARRYDIEKKPGVADFANQPSWRNLRHIVTDFRAAEGQTRYFVVALNPDLGNDIYESFLDSMEIL